MGNTLINDIENIWKYNIAETYANGLICSERLLQAELYHQLKNQTNYNIWIEPTIELKSNSLSHSKPDIIITDINSQIIGVIELKYNLQKGIDIEWDIEKLKEFFRLDSNKAIPLKTNLKNGDWDRNKLFYVSRNIVLILGVIAWKGTEALDT